MLKKKISKNEKSLIVSKNEINSKTEKRRNSDETKLKEKKENNIKHSSSFQVVSDTFILPIFISKELKFYLFNEYSLESFLQIWEFIKDPKQKEKFYLKFEKIKNYGDNFFCFVGFSFIEKIINQENLNKILKMFIFDEKKQIFYFNQFYNLNIKSVKKDYDNVKILFKKKISTENFHNLVINSKSFYNFCGYFVRVLIIIYLKSQNEEIDKNKFNFLNLSEKHAKIKDLYSLSKCLNTQIVLYMFDIKFPFRKDKFPDKYPPKFKIHFFLQNFYYFGLIPKITNKKEKISNKYVYL